MKTLYIDVYFLINFTVDLLSLYFGAMIVKVKSSARRLIIASAVSALFACGAVLFNIKGLVFILSLILCAIIITLIFCKKTTKVRKLKLFGAFLIFETFIGGFVSFIYNLMDTYFYPLFAEGAIGAENKNLILLALLILLAYGVLKLLFIVFEGARSEKNTRFVLGILDKEICIEALVDSGNLLCDPLDSKPVIIVKRNAVSSLIGKDNIIENHKLSSKIRLIPAKSVGGEKIFIGIRSDYIILEPNKIKIENQVIALDEEEGSFGGYMALMPSSVIDPN